jgi:hypothetical protein
MITWLGIQVKLEFPTAWICYHTCNFTDLRQPCACMCPTISHQPECPKGAFRISQLVFFFFLYSV